MKALVFGKTGQVATELQILARKRSVDLIALGRDDADLCQPDLCARIIQDTDADVVINAAAYTAVDRAEQETELAWLINAEAPGAMARAAEETHRPFLHISTDYVFDGSGDTPWTPEDRPRPLSVYGKSKRGGEIAVAEAGGRHCILRTSWAFSAHGSSFLKTMMRLSQSRSDLSVVNDQFGGPTPASAIAEALLTIAGKSLEDGFESGAHHFSGMPDVSWADFAREIFWQAGANVQVTGIPSDAYPTAAARPQNSRLDCSSLNQQFGINRPDWKIAVSDVLNDLGLARQALRK